MEVMDRLADDEREELNIRGVGKYHPPNQFPPGTPEGKTSDKQKNRFVGVHSAYPLAPRAFDFSEDAAVGDTRGMLCDVNFEGEIGEQDQSDFRTWNAP